MFCETTVNNPSLPPCYDSMLTHLKCCNYQSYIWKSALIAQLDIPVGYGWPMTDSKLTPKLMTQAAAPKELDELTVCQYKQSKCASRSCKCVKDYLNVFTCMWLWRWFWSFWKHSKPWKSGWGKMPDYSWIME